MTMKSKQVVVNEKKLSSFESAKAGLRREIKTLQLDVAYEVTRLERLRNEITDIQADKNSLVVARKAFTEEKDSFYKDVVIQKAALSALKADADKKESNATKYLQEANTTSKSTEGRLAAAVQKERDVAEKEQIVLGKKIRVERLAEQNEIGIKILICKKQEYVKKLAELKKDQDAILKGKIEHTALLKQLSEYDASLEKKNQEAEAILKQARVLKIEAESKLAAAKEEARKSQLSVDRQWNEIEIQKKQIKVKELQIKKLIADKKIASDLKKLESK